MNCSQATVFCLVLMPSVVFDALTMIHLRSPSRLIPDALMRLFLDAHDESF